MSRLTPLYVKFVIDEDGKHVLKDGKHINICGVCKSKTTDVVRVYHGHCHRGFIGKLRKLINYYIKWHSN